MVLIGLFEIGFGVTTDLTLLELLDFNNPLLKRFNNRLTVRLIIVLLLEILLKVAADAIGAHALFVELVHIIMISVN